MNYQKMNWINKIKKAFVAAILCASFAMPINLSDASAATSQEVQAAAQTAKQELQGARFDIFVENPFQESTPSAFPNGKDAVFVDVEAIRSDGTFLKDEPLTIEKPLKVNIEGPTDTDGGSFKWKITSTSPIRARIKVKLTRYPNVNRSFYVNFRPNYRITNLTDRNMFIFSTAITFTAQISPSMVDGLKSKRLTYSYIRRYNSWGIWKTRQESKHLDLKCTVDGLCTAKIFPEHTYPNRNVSGDFRYRFEFVDQFGHKFSKSSTGHLRYP